ncbi:hypothetical protein ALC62_06447 [Cyphomyrmex costatus]|uniref:Uncharacterized protein n=1 Tax=Cyphomyrmex costatus TaxID=456900 RepID=A0A195CPI6_9HYME|nr:hypothetical protein ALC62_06447 [Cyphomyrmex costatus]
MHALLYGPHAYYAIVLVSQHHGLQGGFSLTRLQRRPSARHQLGSGREEGRGPSRKRELRLHAAWFSFAISSYLPVKAEFHVSSKMRQADGCDMSRKIERVRVTRTTCIEEECVLAKRRDKV